MCNKARSNSQFERGLTLIELLIFIVIIGIAATAILGVFGSLTRNSASLLPDKQAQAIASSMMNEILALPFTYCDPDDPRAPIATNASSSPPGCTNAGLVESLGPETLPGPTETRGGARPFDNVNDYHGYSQTGITFPDNVTAVPGLGAYQIDVSVANAGANFGLAPEEALQIIVTVTFNGALVARLDGVRFRYAPTTI